MDLDSCQQDILHIQLDQSYFSPPGVWMSSFCMCSYCTNIRINTVAHSSIYEKIHGWGDKSLSITCYFATGNRSIMGCINHRWCIPPVVYWICVNSFTSFTLEPSTSSNPSIIVQCIRLSSGTSGRDCKFICERACRFNFNTTTIHNYLKWRHRLSWGKGLWWPRKEKNGLGEVA